MSKFEFKKFQVEDWSALSLVDGAILGAEFGAGKGIATFVLPFLWLGFSESDHGIQPKGAVLIICPESLHPKCIREAREKFGITNIRKLYTQADYWAHRQKDGTLPDGFYLASYTQIASNGTKPLPSTQDRDKTLNEVAQALAVTARDVNSIPAESIMGTRYTPEERLRRACDKKREEHQDSIGVEVNGIRCVGYPVLAELCCYDFDAVIVDEGVKIKGKDTQIGRGIRLLRPRYRAVLTANPIKNRLADAFFLLWWASGGHPEPTSRFPYSGDAEGAAQFSADFLICERNITREIRKHGYKLPDITNTGRWRSGTATAELCNVAKFWKLTAPLILRRRQEDFGCEMKTLTKHRITAPLGKHQAETYRKILRKEYRDARGLSSPWPKIIDLRRAATCPASPELGDMASAHDYVPKMAATLKLIEQSLIDGDQCVVFSAFKEPLNTVSARLNEAGIPHEVATGDLSAKKRGVISERFAKGMEEGGLPILLASRDSMGEGHSWSRCSNAIHLDYSRPMDHNLQSDKRIHRLDSEADVNSFRIITAGTIDRQLEAMQQEKNQAADMALDGRIQHEHIEEMSPLKLLEIAASEFTDDGTVDEVELAKEWPALRRSLRRAWDMIAEEMAMTK